MSSSKKIPERIYREFSGDFGMDYDHNNVKKLANLLIEYSQKLNILYNKLNKLKQKDIN